MNGLLEEGLEKLPVTVDDTQLERIGRYVRELERWNSRMNLVKATGDTLIVRHILDCVAGVPVIGELPGWSVLDAGSGAGLPGILLAVFFENRRITLLERSAKRVSFLKNAVAVLELDNCTVHEGELEREGGSYDLVCCRAFRPLTVAFSGLAARLAPGGSIVLYKGKKTAVIEETRAVSDAAAGYETRIVGVHVPFLTEERHLLLYRDTSR